MKTKLYFLTTLLSLLTFLFYKPILAINSTICKCRDTTNFDIPFFENWESNSFTTNNWTISDNAWTIDSLVGNLAPSAKFNGGDSLTNYFSTLISNRFNAVNIGEIYLSFDLMLSDINETGTEWLYVEIFNDDKWIKIDSMSNMGSFLWKNYSFNITSIIKYKDFRIGIETSGLQSNNISGWYIDNVSLYKICASPQKLTVKNFWNNSNDWGVKTSWYAPEMPELNNYTCRYDNYENYSAIGLSDGGNFTVAIRWDTNQLISYDSTMINKIFMFIFDNTADYFVVKIWTDSNASNLIFADTLTNVQANSWNSITINDTIFINSTLEYWVGYEIIGQEPNTFPAGIDIGPAVDGYGDMVSITDSTWTTLFENGINSNWNLGMELIVPGFITTLDTLLGFNIYRTFDNDTNYSYITTVPYEDGKLYYEFTEEHISPPVVCYKVNAIWKNGNDTCYSDYASALNNPLDTHVCLISNGINENDLKKHKVLLFPNPVKKSLNIISKSSISHIFVYDLQGKVIFNIPVDNIRSVKLDVSGLSKGLYVIKLFNGQGAIMAKFMK